MQTTSQPLHAKHGRHSSCVYLFIVWTWINKTNGDSLVEGLAVVVMSGREEGCVFSESYSEKQQKESRSVCFLKSIQTDMR